MNDLQRILEEATARERRLSDLLGRAVEALELANREKREWADLTRQATEVANAFKEELERARMDLAAANETMRVASETIRNLRAENERLTARLRRLS